MGKILDKDLKDKEIKILCYKIRMIEGLENKHYIQKPHFKFGINYKNWKNRLNKYDDMIFKLYNELSELIEKY